MGGAGQVAHCCNGRRAAVRHPAALLVPAGRPGAAANPGPASHAHRVGRLHAQARGGGRGRLPCRRWGECSRCRSAALAAALLPCWARRADGRSAALLGASCRWPPSQATSLPPVPTRPPQEFRPYVLHTTYSTPPGASFEGQAVRCVAAGAVAALPCTGLQPGRGSAGPHAVSRSLCCHFCAALLQRRADVCAAGLCHWALLNRQQRCGRPLTSHALAGGPVLPSLRLVNLCMRAPASPSTQPQPPSQKSKLPATHDREPCMGVQPALGLCLHPI